VKVAIVHDWLTGMRGGEKCLERACRLFPEAQIFTLLHRPQSTSPVIERMPITTSFLARLPGALRYYRYLLPLMPRAVESLRLPTNVDAVLSFSHAVAKSVRVPQGIPHLCYCFTPMRYAWHMRAEYFQPPLAVPASRVVPRAISTVRDYVLDRLQRWDAETSDRVDQFIAVSREVQARIQAAYDRHANVIYPPVDVEYFTPTDLPREDYYLCVSALVPYKRLDMAIAACRQLGRRLVIVGDGPDRRRLLGMAGGEVSLVGWQSRGVLRDHYRRCRGLLFPGHEDFGIVPVEAQACGAPVIALGRGGTLESIREPIDSSPGSGRFFSETTTDSLVEAILAFEQSSHSFCPQIARENAERFDAGRFDRELKAAVVALTKNDKVPRDHSSPSEPVAA